MIKIGDKDWVRDIMSITEPLGSDFWEGFTPVTAKEISDLSKTIRRTLDPEFCEFYRTIGYGPFCNTLRYGGIYSPREVEQSIASAIYFITGSMTPGKEWAPLDQQVDLWLTRGRSNPNRAMFTEDALTLDGVRLYDLLQIGSDGCCGYQQLYVGPEPAPLRYCLLTEVQEMEDRAATFSGGLEAMLLHHLGE